MSEQNPQHSGATLVPTRAPASFASLEPVVRVDDGRDIYVAEWAGSGLAAHDHPMRCASDVCRGCGSTNTVVVWARSEHVFTHGGWSEHDYHVYELHCRDCGRFSLWGA